MECVFLAFFATICKNLTRFLRLWCVGLGVNVIECMRRLFTLFIYIALGAAMLHAQERTVQNRPYTDLRPFHLGIVVGTHLQDLEFDNIGQQMLTLEDGRQVMSNVGTDQHNWDLGFNVGVLGELRLNEFFAFRMAPQMYFGTRNIAFYDYNRLSETGGPYQERQSLKTVYVGADLNVIYAAQRFNNHRPYLMAGLAPVLNLSSGSGDYVRLKKSDVFLEVGMGCDFYLPFFKLRPELKFMYGLSNCLDNSHLATMRNDSALPYAASVSQAHSKMIVLSFYFE